MVSGDTTKLVTSMPLDSSHMLTAPLVVDDLGTVGAWSIMLPGVTIGRHATLAPTTVPLAGSDCKPRTVYLGAPAQAVKVPSPRLLSVP